MRIRYTIILGFFFLLTFAPRTGLAVGTNYELFSKLLGDKDPDQYNITWDKIFGSDEEDFGQNLYLQIYQNVVYKPESEALKETAQSYGLTLAEAQNVIEGSITPILQSQKNNVSFTQEDALREVYAIQHSFDEKLALKDLKGAFEAESEPSEIFANGDLSDSGFDLISDLDVIEYYLFIEKTPNVVNKTLPANEKKYLPSKGVQLDTPQSSYASYDTASSGLATGESSSGGSGGGESSDKNSGSGSSGKTGKSGNASGSDNPLFTSPSANENACLNTPTLEDAVENFDTAKLSSAAPQASSGTAKPTAQPSSGSENGNIGGSAGDNTASSLPPELLETPLSAAPNDFPFDPSLCGDLKTASNLYYKDFSANANNKAFTSFCFGIQSKTREYGTFYPTKPCINCTIAKINQAFKETVSHSLVPSKLTGNIFESAKCKKGVNLSDLLDFNVFFVPMPILTPPKYSQYEGHNVAREFELYKNKYLPFEKSREQQSLPQEDEETVRSNQAFAQCLGYSDENTTQIDLLNCTDQILSQTKGLQQKNLAESVESIPLKISAEFYQPLDQELARMTAFFRIFQNTFSEIQTNTCPNLRNKPVKVKK